MPESSRHVVQIVLLGVLHLIIVAVFVWDVWMIASGHKWDTVSAILRTWSVTYPEILIPVGYLLCHLFGR